MTLAHERLEVYGFATEHLALAMRIVGATPRGSGFVADQYRRAALSIPLNIAEGVGRTGEEDQKRFFAHARGSAMECAAILDAARLEGMVDEPTALAGKELLERIVRMLTGLCRRRGKAGEGRCEGERAKGGSPKGESPSRGVDRGPGPGPGPGSGPAGGGPDW